MLIYVSRHYLIKVLLKFLKTLTKINFSEYIITDHVVKKSLLNNKFNEFFIKYWSVKVAVHYRKLSTRNRQTYKIGQFSDKNCTLHHDINIF